MKNKFMKEAFLEAKKAFVKDEVPIGAVVVKDGEVIARAHNMKEELQLATAHAEILVIEQASKKLGTWYLDDCELYVTVEPCAMCSGAIIQSRIKKVYYGAKGLKFGTHQSVIKILDSDKFTHLVEVETGIMEQESSELMKDFFKKLRK